MDPTTLTSTTSLRTETNPKWIRGMVGQELVVDSRDALFVWEVPYYPQWYFPVADVNAELRPTGEVRPTDDRGDGVVNDLIIEHRVAGDRCIEDRVVPGAALTYPDSPVGELRNRVRILWDGMDRWLEEEVEVFVHPRSPYTRVDALPSSRHVVVRVAGQVVAESDRPTILYETGLPARYYLPPEDVVDGVLVPTETESACPYKGVARYWSVTLGGDVHRDLVWGYDEPLPESAPVKGLVCFYNEKVELEVDGVVVERPVTKFS